MYTHCSSAIPIARRSRSARSQQMKQRGEKIACLTAYDASFAALLDAAGVDVVLVGDSLGMVIQGHDTTVPVTMDHMVYHCAAVARGLHRPFLIADLPFMSYPSRELALTNAVRLMQEGGARMVKLESGRARPRSSSSSPATTSRCARTSGSSRNRCTRPAAFACRAATTRPRSACSRMRWRWRRPAPTWCCSSAFRPRSAARITQALKVPVIGIGAGPDTDGQILVLYDILDITPGRKPRFVRNFMAGSASPQAAVARYVQAVKSGDYPAPEHCF